MEISQRSSIQVEHSCFDILDLKIVFVYSMLKWYKVN